MVPVKKRTKEEIEAERIAAEKAAKNAETEAKRAEQERKKKEEGARKKRDKEDKERREREAEAERKRVVEEACVFSTHRQAKEEARGLFCQGRALEGTR